jgi:hypothetical protein
MRRLGIRIVVRDSARALKSMNLSAKLGTLHAHALSLMTRDIEIGLQAVDLCLEASNDAFLIINEILLAVMLSDCSRKLALHSRFVHAVVLTLRQDLPLGCLRTTVGGLGVTESVEEVLHLHASLALGQLVGDAQLGSTGVWLGRSRRAAFTILKFTDLAMLEAVMMSGNLIFRGGAVCARWDEVGWHAIFKTTLPWWQGTRLGSKLA